MGLDTTHDCWHGSYGRFNEFRNAVSIAAGLGALHQYQGFGGWKEFPSEFDEPLVALLDHSDCDGEIPVVSLVSLADRLESLLRNLPAGHVDDAKRWVVGLRAAAEEGVPVEFR